jgi:predicted extracellular nuclease/2',3'-cyclic-nucleotide 2'-phosphodiesterase (5'-nucleotidase family)
MANVWINEFHYDDSGTDIGEFIEIAGVAGTDVTGWTIVRYNGTNGAPYTSPGAIPSLSGLVPNSTATGFGFLVFTLPQDGLQNGAPDGIALVDNLGNVVEFISYEGTMTASAGPAAGLPSTDVDVDESGTADGTSIARAGTGNRSSDFTFALATDDTPGVINIGQLLGDVEGQTFSIAATDAVRPEGTDGTTPFTFTVTRVEGVGTATVDWALSGIGAAGQANSTDFSDATSGALTFADLETTQTITLNVVGDAVVEANEAFSVTLSNPSAGIITTATANGTIENDDRTPIHAIQGNSHTSRLVGQIVTTTGVVTALDTNGSRGFYIQDPTGDGNAATSDGIFVFLPSGPLPAVGRLVEVTGTVAEFTPSSAAIGSLSTTELTAVTSIVDRGVGPAIAPTVIGGPGGLLPPTESLIAGTLFFEKLESMVVTVVNPIAVGPTNDFGEIFTVVDNDADPANGLHATGQIARGNLLITPGAPDFGDSNSSAGDFNPERIQIDDDNGVLAGFVSPDVNVGARLASVTGVVNYDFGNYQVVATQAFSVAQASMLAKETGTLTGDADHLLVASYNAENLDPKLEDQSKVANQSASNVDNDLGTGKFDTIANEILNILKAPDIIALQEIQDNDGAELSAVTSASLTLQTLVDKLNALSALAGPNGPRYAFIDNPFIGNGTNGGQPGGNIRTAFLYRDDRVDLVEGSLRTIAADGTAISDPDGNTDQQENSDNPFFTSRPPLVATFSFNGEEVTVIDNHFTSKGGSAPLFGADQPPFNAGEVQRAAQAQAVNTFVDNLLVGDPNAKVIVAGDLNEFPSEEPMSVMRGTATISNYDVPGSDPFAAIADYSAGGTAVLSDLLELLPDNQQYDYVFEGNSQTLDHVLVTQALTQGAEFDVIRINAEFADQTSDHDPLVARFEIEAASQNFILQLLHLSDGEAGLLASQTAPNLAALVDAFDDDYANTLILAGGDNFLPGPFLAAGTDLSVIPALNAATGSTIAATTNVPIGALDIAIHNVIGVEASTIGNHEFDLGSRVLRDAFSPNLGAAGWVGAQFPYLSGNLDFSGDADLNPRFTNTLDGGTGTLVPEANTLKGRIAQSVVITEGGERIGIVAATTQLIESISSPTGTEVQGFPTGPGPNGEVDDMALLALQLQPIIDELIAEGVNKIILQSHLQQIANEQALATRLRGVDIILAAGSNTRLGDADDLPVAFPGHSADFNGTYPLQVPNADGKTTLIVNTDGEYTYLGRLVVEFDANGETVLDSVLDNEPINGAYAATVENVAAAWDTRVAELDTTAFAEGTKGDKVRDLTSAVQDVIIGKDGEVFGLTNVYLEGERNVIRNQQTNLGDITADANAFVGRNALADAPLLVSLKNAGGIRAQIGTVSDPDPVTGEIDKLPPAANPAAGKPEGGVSRLDIENALRFNNKLMVFDTTPQGLLNILNWGAGLSPSNGGFPQIGGVRFSFDPDLPGNSGATPGSRIINVALIDDEGNTVPIVEGGVVRQDAPSTITVVTLNFTANGGDGYPIKANAENFRFILNDGTLSAPVSEVLDFVTIAPVNALGEQDAFADFLQAFHSTPETAYDQADTPIALDTRIQNVNFRADTILANAEPIIVGDFAIMVGEGQTVPLTTADLNEADPDNGGAALTYTVTGTVGGDVVLNGHLTASFSQADLAAGLVGFRQNGAEGNGSFTVTLTDLAGETSPPATVMVEVSPVNDAPVFTSSATFAVAENTTAVGAVSATDAENNPMTFATAGGADQAFFAIDAQTGALHYLAAPDFETQEDSNADNVYEVIISATDSAGAVSTQTLAVQVTNMVEPGRTINGDFGSNLLSGGPGNDRISGGSFGNDQLNGNDGNDRLNGGFGNDVLSGGRGDDRLEGGFGNDRLDGAAGSDALDGGFGSDRLDGGTGNDKLTGFLGDDVFAFRAGFGHDVVTDFNRFNDVIEFHDGLFGSFHAVLAASEQIGNDTVITLDASNLLVLEDVQLRQLSANDFFLL